MSAKQTIQQTRFFTDAYSVLDATLRDAGYLNNWSFSRSEIFNAVGGVAKAGVEAIEVGYLSDKPDRFLAGCCGAELLSELHQHVGGETNLVGMISLSEENPASLLASRQGVLDLVRIPCTISQIPNALQVAEVAQKYKIACSLNLVNVSTLSVEQLKEVSCQVQQAKTADLFYLADSRGACHPEEVRTIVSTVREHWTGLLGFHAHDNTGFADVNTLIALEAGCQIIDGTINGLGLGSGNTKISHALAIVQQKQPDKPYQYQHLDSLCRHFSVPMPAEKSYLYYLVGAKNLAQLWVEPLLERYGADTIRYLQDLPRKPYLHIEQVIKEIES